MYELGQHMAHVLPARQWRSVRGLLDLAQRADGPFSFSPAETYRLAEAFRAAAAHPKMPACWAQSASELAEIAGQHRDAGKPWRWS
jgi:hypothetical protein